VYLSGHDSDKLLFDESEYHDIVLRTS
jgi:hypothetical protein